MYVIDKFVMYKIIPLCIILRGDGNVSAVACIDTALSYTTQPILKGQQHDRSQQSVGSLFCMLANIPNIPEEVRA